MYFAATPEIGRLMNAIEPMTEYSHEDRYACAEYCSLHSDILS